MLGQARDSLDEEEVVLLESGGLHLGRVIDEHREHFGRGDFLVRNVVGADRTSGAIAVGEAMALGTTVQFHLRDAATADEDLHALVSACRADAALVFTCNGRGTRLFGAPHHDVRVLSEHLGAVPMAGFFAAGELGPVGGRNFVHGFTASVALLRDRSGDPDVGPRVRREGLIGALGRAGTVLVVTEAELEQLGINVIRGLAMDAPQKADSGHPGTAMALAPLAHVLFTRIMRHDPADPQWPDRDRFILSNGHASILLYSFLFLTGYGLTLDDIKQFRQWGSKTPGHPEVHLTAGVEVTTGPLGQGVGNGVGMGIAERWLRARFGPDLVDHHTFVICGDGDLMEGISHEAASLAGHLGLGRLVYIYDDNHITIDGPTELAYTDIVAERFDAYGWHTDNIGEVANDTDALEAAVRRAMAVEDKPSMILLRSHIGWPSPHKTDTAAAHGSPLGEDEIRETKAILGLPPDEQFWVPDEVVELYRRCLVARQGAPHGVAGPLRRLGRRQGDVGRLPARRWARGLGREAPGVRGRHRARHACRRQPVHHRHRRGDPGSDGGIGRPHRQHRREAHRRREPVRRRIPRATRSTTGSASTPWGRR